MRHISRTHHVRRDSFIYEHIITHHLRSIRVHDEFVRRDSFIHEHINTHHLRSIRVHDEFVRRDSFIHLSLTHNQPVLISRHAYAWVMQYTAIRHATYLHKSCHTLYLWRCISDEVLWCVRESLMMMCSWCISYHVSWCVRGSSVIMCTCISTNTRCPHCDNITRLEYWRYLCPHSDDVFVQHN